MPKVSSNTRTHTHPAQGYDCVCVFVCRSPAVECCADVATRNEGLELNLEGERKRRRVGVIRVKLGD